MVWLGGLHAWLWIALVLAVMWVLVVLGGSPNTRHLGWLQMILNVWAVVVTLFAALYPILKVPVEGRGSYMGGAAVGVGLFWAAYLTLYQLNRRRSRQNPATGGWQSLL